MSWYSSSADSGRVQGHFFFQDSGQQIRSYWGMTPHGRGHRNKKPNWTKQSHLSFFSWMTYAVFAYVPLAKASPMAQPCIYGVGKPSSLWGEGRAYLQIIIQSTIYSEDFVILGKLLQLPGLQFPRVSYGEISICFLRFGGVRNKVNGCVKPTTMPST